MPARRIIPSLLLRGERLVKGVQFDDYRDAGNPVTTARVHNAQGADELLLIDIDASREGRPPMMGLIADVAAECFMPLTVGGGIRSLDDARQCMDAGADKLCINTGALDRPDLIGELAQVFGAQAVVVSIDIDSAKAAPAMWDFRAGQLHARGDAMAWIAEAIERGAGEIRIMACDREGRRNGLTCDHISKIAERIETPLIVEGGAGTFQHIADAYTAGADGVCLGTILVFEDNNLVKVKRTLQSLGQNMRT